MIKTQLQGTYKLYCGIQLKLPPVFFTSTCIYVSLKTRKRYPRYLLIVLMIQPISLFNAQSMSNDQSLTQLIDSWQNGNESAFSELSELVYHELRRLARKHMAGERKNHTLQATALVNEAFVRLINAEISYESRAHFYAMAGSMMRRILIDHARSVNREKRGGGVRNVTLHESEIMDATPDVDLLELNAALESLEKQDKRKANILELQFFAGLSCKEIAEVLDVSSRTVERDVQFAKAWLHRELHPNPDKA